MSSIDLFASRMNMLLPDYSWRPDTGVIYIVAFSGDWDNQYIYSFPPFSVIESVMKKLEEESGS